MRKVGVLALLVIAGVVVHDVVVPAPHAFGARAAITVIDVYRQHVSPKLRGVVTCRFQPTCSYYGRESIRKHGLLIGGAKTAGRIVRCGPWTKQGTIDPP
jgi:uncharacterized protein